MTTFFGKELTAYLALKGMTQSQLALHVGCTPSAISRYCIGSRLPRWPVLAAICEALELRPVEEDDLALAALETARLQRREEHAR